MYEVMKKTHIKTQFPSHCAFCLCNW